MADTPTLKQADEPQVEETENKVEPGNEFEIEYGDGHRLTVVALSARQRRKVIAQVATFQETDTKTATLEALDAAYEALEAALRLCYPKADDAFIDTLDEDMHMDIIGGTLKATRLSGEEQKKLESPR